MRSIGAKLGERKSIADYALPSDAGDYAPAIERASAAGVTDLILPAGTQYTLKRPFTLPSANMRLTCDGQKTTEVRLLGANDYFGIVGNATTTSYNFYVEGCLLTKEQASSKGAILKLQNVYKWGFNYIRVYGEDKFWRVLELVTASAGISRNVDVDHILDRAVYATGGTAPFGTPSGGVIDNIFDLWYVISALVNPADPTTAGLFDFVDNYQAQWVTNLKAAKFKGYAVNFGGTVANRGTNTLNLVFNPNIEASEEKVGVVRFGAVVSSQVGGPASWVSATGMPAFALTADSQNNTVRGLQVGLAGTGAQAVSDAGTLNLIEDIEAVGYDANADAGLAIGSTASKGRYRRLKVAQLKRVIVDQSPDTAGHSIEDVTYTAITGQPLTGLAGTENSNKVVKDITNLDAGAPTLGAAATLSLPDKGETFTINTAGTINLITPTYIGRRVTLLLAQGGTTIGDLQGGKGTGAIYLGKPLTTTDGRSRITLEWRCDYWWEISRTH
ncbi:hypothetical protein C0214_07815 [Methylobacterium sp. DM1]|nr:hypothetical protein C0214_07815 [Methylobacterium sp. DM1]